MFWPLPPKEKPTTPNIDDTSSLSTFIKWFSTCLTTFSVRSAVAPVGAWISVIRMP